MTFELDIEPALYWVTERECMRIAKEELRDPPPWTNDPILANWRFCNVRREDDVVTRWIAKHIRKPFARHPHLWFMLCIARVINLRETLAELIATNGAWPDDKNFDLNTLMEVLEARKAREEQVYSGAYTITAGGKNGSKNVYVANTVLRGLWFDRRTFVDWFAGDNPTLEGTTQRLSRHEGWGPFMRYQATVDMRFTPLLNRAPDIETFAEAGPGTIQGLNRLHGRVVGADISQKQALAELRELYRVLRRKVPEEVGEIDFSDVPNICCEVDKYLRMKNGESKKLRNRYTPRQMTEPDDE